MSQPFLLAIIILCAVNLILLLVLLIRKPSAPYEPLARMLREELRAAREEAASSGKLLREELAAGLKTQQDTVNKTLAEAVNLQKTQLASVEEKLGGLTRSNLETMENLRSAVERRLAAIQESSEAKLDEMRKIVSEKLETTLERRLGESFKTVSDQLQAVHQGLGEMQALASGVGDLKRLLSNIKARGTWGEIQLGALIEEILPPEHFGCNVCLDEETNCFVEYAVKLPGPDKDPASCVWLPIDSKFPMAVFERVVAASESADPEQLSAAHKDLRAAVLEEASKIRSKYIAPPRTTDFAIMFLPLESLYAEVTRLPGLLEELQTRHRVIPAGPTTLTALLNSLRVGFRTLALQEKAGEVWEILAAVKAEFQRFQETFEKVKKQMRTVTNTLETEVGRRTRAMERKLRQVESLELGRAEEVLELGTGNGELEDEEDEEG